MAYETRDPQLEHAKQAASRRAAHHADLSSAGGGRMVRLAVVALVLLVLAALAMTLPGGSGDPGIGIPGDATAPERPAAGESMITPAVPEATPAPTE